MIFICCNKLALSIIAPLYVRFCLPTFRCHHLQLNRPVLSCRETHPLSYLQITGNLCEEHPPYLAYLDKESCCYEVIMHDTTSNISVKLKYLLLQTFHSAFLNHFICIFYIYLKETFAFFLSKWHCFHFADAGIIKILLIEAHGYYLFLVIC